MRFIEKAPDIEEIVLRYALSEDMKKKRMERIKETQDILSGSSGKKIICIGPCSADREDAVVDYCIRLAKLQDKVKDIFVIIPRVYTSKPRTTGEGYKGMLHRPKAENKHENLIRGIIASRKMHLHVIEQTGMFAADEMLYPEVTYYWLDLLGYTAIGARSVENQGHRMAASGLEVPVGMKNPMSGDLHTLLNSILAAQLPQTMLFCGWEVETEGNMYSHAILRGFQNGDGKMCPNYHYETLCELYDLYHEMNLHNMAVLIDCNHCNSGKHYDEQVRISKEIFHLCRQNRALDSLVKGIMIESYLEDGQQLIGEGCYGKSITDSCIGWKKTEKLILQLADFY